jgi:hypothetical protein
MQGQPPELFTNDQWLSLTDQLNIGVRFVELDTHWVAGELRTAHCGGLHAPVIDTILRALNALSKLAGKQIHWDTETVGYVASTLTPSFQQYASSYASLYASSYGS